MIPLIQNEVVQNKKWISDEDVIDIIAISESTPGPIAINCATFIGYKVGGVLGSFFATFGVVLPSFIIITLISSLLNEFGDYKVVKYAFYGIKAGVLALVIKAWWTMYKKVKKDIMSYILMIAAFVAVAVFDINALIVILFCAIIGVISSLVIGRRKR